MQITSFHLINNTNYVINKWMPDNRQSTISHSTRSNNALTSSSFPTANIQLTSTIASSPIRSLSLRRYHTVTVWSGFFGFLKIPKRSMLYPLLAWPGICYRSRMRARGLLKSFWFKRTPGTLSPPHTLITTHISEYGCPSMTKPSLIMSMNAGKNLRPFPHIKSKTLSSKCSQLYASCKKKVSHTETLNLRTSSSTKAGTSCATSTKPSSLAGASNKKLPAKLWTISNTLRFYTQRQSF